MHKVRYAAIPLSWPLHLLRYNGSLSPHPTKQELRSRRAVCQACDDQITSAQH